MQLTQNSALGWSVLVTIGAAACATPADHADSSQLPVQTQVPSVSSSPNAPDPDAPNPSNPPNSQCVPAPPLAFINGGGSSCTEDDCGSNTPFVNLYQVDELHLVTGGLGLPNHDGVRYAGFIAPSGQSGYLFAEHGELLARVPGSSDFLRGHSLIGSKIIIQDVATGVPDVIVVYDYRVDDSWVEGSNVAIHNYLLTYSPDNLNPGAPWCYFRTPICNLGAQSGDETFTWVVVLTEERYHHHPINGLVLPSIAISPAFGWLNLACHGTALNKARRMEYYPDPGPGGAPPTTGEQREAVLQSITAAYCNKQTFTQDGTPVAWQNVSGTVDTTPLYEDSTNSVELQIESIWNAAGAVCVDTLRLPSMADRVEDECLPLLQAPSCTELLEKDPALEAHGEMITYVPVEVQAP